MERLVVLVIFLLFIWYHNIHTASTNGTLLAKVWKMPWKWQCAPHFFAHCRRALEVCTCNPQILTRHGPHWCQDNHVLLRFCSSLHLHERASLIVCVCVCCCVCTAIWVSLSMHTPYREYILINQGLWSLSQEFQTAWATPFRSVKYGNSSSTHQEC